MFPILQFAKMNLGALFIIMLFGTQYFNFSMLLIISFKSKLGICWSSKLALKGTIAAGTFSFCCIGVNAKEGGGGGGLVCNVVDWH